MPRIPAFLIALASLAAVAPASAGQFDALHWRMIGPFRGGRTTAVAGVAGDPNLAYSGAVAGGVWRTIDAGRTWTPIFDGQGIASIGAIAVAPSAPSVIYVGSGEADMRSDITYGDGMYKSTDAGATWSHIGLRETRQIARIAVDAADPDRVFVAALGHAYGPNAERGVFRSTDGGTTWQRVLFRDENTGAIDVEIDPNDRNTIAAALWQTRRPPWSVYPASSGPGGGLYLSHDGGTTWNQVNGGGFPGGTLGRMGIAFAPSAPGRIYVLLDAGKGGLYRSDDGGATWRIADGDQRLWGRGWYFCTLAVDGKNADTVYISDTAFYRSRDGGAHFTAVKGSPDGDDFHQPWTDPRDPDHLILASDQGTSISVNGGRTWSSWFNQPTAQFYHIAADDQFPFRVYGAQQDSGAAMVPAWSDDNGISAADWQMIVAGGEAGYIAPDPLHPDVLFGDNVTREDRVSLQARSVDPTTAYPGAYRSEWTLPLTFDPLDRRTLYFGRQMIFRSSDGGATWRIISPDLTRPDPGVPATLDAPAAANSGGLGTRKGVVYAIAPSPAREGTIWAGTDDGTVWLTDDAGVRWRNVTPPKLGPWSKVGVIEASRFDVRTAYVAIDRHRLDDIAPYIYKTHDGGTTWTPVMAGIPMGAYVNAVREDPGRRGLLYAGTELGVFVSFDDGAHWQSLRLNMPVVPVRDLVVKQDSLAIATHGRAFWVLDDLAPLRQWTAGVARADAWLFAPETAHRVRPHFDRGERLPPEEPTGENRPVGAYLDYTLRDSQTTPVVLTIADAAGAIIARFSSADKALSISPDAVDFPAFWLPVPQTVSTAAGMHRFIWDFHYAPMPGETPLGFGPPRGPLAPPGAYAMRLRAGGRTWSQQLVVARDPRVRATDADLVAEFQLARRIEAAQVTAARAYALASHRGLKTLAGGPPASNPDNSIGTPPVEFKSLYAVGQALDGLQGAVESADAAPTRDQVAAFAHWQAVLAVDVAALAKHR